MLYASYELQKLFLNKTNQSLKGAGGFFKQPLINKLFPILGANIHILERLTREYQHPEFGLDTTLIEGKVVKVYEEVVLKKSFCQLLHFKRVTEKDDPRVLIVAPLSGHYATLLRGTVEALLPHFDVYITDWYDARNVPVEFGSFNLDDYIEYIIDFLRFFGPDLHVISVCQPTVPVLAAVSLLARWDDPAQPKSMVLMGGPVDTRAGPTEVTRFSKSKPLEWFKKNTLSVVPINYRGRGRLVCPGFLMLSGFMSLDIERHLNAQRRHYQSLIVEDLESAEAHEKFYDEYRSVMDLPAEYVLQTVQTVFHEHALPQGFMKWRSYFIDPGVIEKTALMTVEGEKDNISGLGQTKAAQDLCHRLPRDKKCHYEQKSVGHYGIFNGHRWRTYIMPKIRSFIYRHHE